MRKMRVAFLLLFWLLFPAAGDAEIVITPEILAAGDLVQIRLEDDRQLNWSFRMKHEDRVVFEQMESVRKSGFFCPDQTGEYTFYAMAQDENGEDVCYEKTFTVMEAWNGQDNVPIMLLGENGAFYTQGGVRHWVVQTQGKWMASTQDDFIEIRRDRGVSGDYLVIAVENSDGVYRTGSITISAAGYELDVPVVQSSGCGMEEEVYLQQTGDWVMVDEKTCVSWLDAAGECAFQVRANGNWQARCDVDFVNLTQENDQLLLQVTENDTAESRDAWVTLACGQATAYVYVQQSPDLGAYVPEKADADTSWTEPERGSDIVLYSQQDGSWKNVAYRDSNLEHSGCAIFALSHALQLMGYEGEDILPQNLAKTYAFCLLEGGTMNSTLIGHAGEDFGFKTRYELYHNLGEIRNRMEKGAVYSFAVVNGHIALVAGMSEDGSKFRIIDSAPSATMERIKNGQIYYRDARGEFVPVSDLDQLPGSRYYYETNGFGGYEYYLDASYVAKRGVRLIQPIEAK